MINSKVKVSEFLSIALKLLSESGNIIRSTISSKDLKTKYKGEKDPVTIADLKIQNLLKKGILNFYPNLKIIGEEDNSEFDEGIEMDFNSIDQNLVNENLFGKENNEFEIEDSITWIDPLDGTINFVSGSYDGVTTLLGISRKGNPYLGIVAQYYQKKDEEFIYDPYFYFSLADVKKVFYVQESKIDFKNGVAEFKELEQLNNPYSKENFVVVTSKNHSSDIMMEKTKLLNPTDIKFVGGCGNKMLQVAKKFGHVYFYPSRGTSKWDSCAPSSLILSLGGYVKDIEGNNIDYTDDILGNEKGLIATLESEILENAIKFSK